MTTPDEPTEPEFSTWAELDAAIKEHGGVLRVAMWALRDIDGYGRLGVRVLTTIHDKLMNIGVDHLPTDLPNNQHQHVVLYKIGSEAGAVISAVRNGTSTVDAEDALRRLNTSENLQDARQKDALLWEASEKVEELQEFVTKFRALLDGEETE